VPEEYLEIGVHLFGFLGHPLFPVPSCDLVCLLPRDFFFALLFYSLYNLFWVKIGDYEEAHFLGTDFYNACGWFSENLIADSYGGRVAGKFELKQSGERDLEYLLQVGFENIDLKQFLSHAKAVADPEEKVPDGAKPKQAPHKNDTSGKVNGSLSLLGQISEVHRSNTGRSEVGGDVHSSIGRCKLTISDMQVGKLSLLAKLLYVL